MIVSKNPGIGSQTVLSTKVFSMAYMDSRIWFLPEEDIRNRCKSKIKPFRKRKQSRKFHEN